MKLDATRFGHATGIVGAGSYLVCWFIVGLMPMFYRGMMNSWFHGFDISGLPARALPMGISLYGLVTFTVFAWVFGYALAALPPYPG